MKEDRLARIAELKAKRKRELKKHEDAKGDKLKWKRDIWEEKDLFDGETPVHYLRGIEGVGPKLSNLTRRSFQRLYTKITDIFRFESNKQLNMGALGFLESWSIHFGPEDHVFLHDSQIFPVIRSLVTRQAGDEIDANINDQR